MNKINLLVLLPYDFMRSRNPWLYIVEEVNQRQFQATNMDECFTQIVNNSNMMLQSKDLI